MKNAMKKLMAFALVAVMLVGMVPFAASADEGNLWVDVIIDWNGGDPIFERYLQSELTNGYITDTSKITSNSTYQALDIDAWTYDGAQYTSVTQIDFSELSESVNVEPVYGTPVVDYCDECGEVLTDDHVCKCDTCGKPDTEGHDCLVYCDRCEEARFAHEHAEYVDVILNVKGDSSYVENDYFRCYLQEDGTISQDDRDEIYFTSSKLNIIAWKADGYGQKSTLLDFNFAKLEKAINIYPVYAGSEDEGENNENTENEGDDYAEYIKLNIYVDGNYEESKFFSQSQAVKNMLATVQSSSWDFDYYLLNDSEVEKTNTDKVIELGNTVNVFFEKHVSKLNSNKVYLHVFMNNDFDDPVKNLNITNGIAKDGLVNVNGDVKELIKEYFSAKDSDGIGYDGLYVSTGDWAGDFLKDDKRTVVDDIVELKEEGYVHLNIMITNAKLKSASTADSSNPKTGDNIFVAVSVMTVAAGALAVAFYLNKKRAV